MKYEIPINEFYKLNPVKMERYLPFFAEQMKKKREDMTNIGWANGLYTGYAIASCFSKSKKYPEQPIELWKHGATNESSESFTDADRFAGFAASFNRRFEKKE